MDVRAHDVAAHEAAHAVVGLACGLRLKRVTLLSGSYSKGYELLGYAEFHRPRGGAQEALALMHAAGVAWDRGLRIPGQSSEHDSKALRELVHSWHDHETMITAAAAILAGRMPAHARVTRALLEGDLTGEDLAKVCTS